jgi:hypothetical protein
MAEPFIVLVLVLSAGDASPAPTWSTVPASAQKAIGANAVVLLQEAAETPSDAEALSLAERVRASALVEVRWADSSRNKATLRVHVPQSSQWLDRLIEFSDADAPPERGRTLGFAFGAMISQVQHAEEAAPQPPPAPPAEGGQAMVPPARRESPRRFGVEAAAVGRLGIGGDAEGVGGGAGFRWYIVPEFALRAGGDVRTGNVPSARATSLAVEAGAGVGWRPFVSSARRPYELGFRADFLLMALNLTRTSASTATTTTATRWINGADLVVEAGWFPLASVGLVGAAGVETAFGDTNVYVGTVRVATIPVWRAVGELGVRVLF